MNKFKGAFEELDPFLSTYDLAMLCEVDKEVIHSIFEELFPDLLQTKRVIKYTDHKGKTHIHTEYYIDEHKAELILKRARELNIPFNIN